MDSIRFADSVFKLASPGVFGIFDETTKRVFVSCGNNVVKGIAGVVTKIKNMDHSCGNMIDPEVRILYLGTHPKHQATKIMTQLSESGYEIVNKTLPVLWEAKIRVLEGVPVVTLRSARGNELIVGAFKTMPECKDWFSATYPNGYVDEIVDLGDALTQEVQKQYE